MCKLTKGPKVCAKLIICRDKRVTQGVKCKHIIFICDLKNTNWKLALVGFSNGKQHLILAFYHSRIRLTCIWSTQSHLTKRS
jgi:hypothetical protein